MERKTDKQIIFINQP